MAQSVKQMLAELEDRFTLGEVLEDDYRVLKWQLIKKLKEQGELLDEIGGSIRREDIKDAFGNTFCYVDPSPFIYGDDDRYGECKAAYYIAKFPVTVRDFTTFLEQSGWDYPEQDIEQMRLVCPDPDCPVSHVSWLDAKEYCRWLRKVTCEYYSLPHELEWEKAARGVDGRFCPWGDDVPTDDRACFHGGVTYTSTVPVGSFPANLSPYGCVDMVGNVWEWCLDSFSDPRDPHLLRGGAWCNTVDYCNCLSRTFSYPPEKRLDVGGIRLLYLPHDMLIEYRRQYAGDEAQSSQAQLRVVGSSSRRQRPQREERRKASSGDLSAALAAAIARAAEAIEPLADMEPEDDTAAFANDLAAALGSAVAERAEEAEPTVAEEQTAQLPSQAPEGVPSATTAMQPAPVPRRRQRDKLSLRGVGADGEEDESLTAVPKRDDQSGILPVLEEMTGEDTEEVGVDSVSDEELDMYEQMAQAINNASQQFIEAKKASPPVVPAEDRARLGGASIQVVTHERGSSEAGALAEDVISFDDDEPSVPIASLDPLDAEAREKAERRKQALAETTALTYLCFGVWCALLAVVLGLVVYRMAGL